MSLGGSQYADRYVLGLPLYGNQWAADSASEGSEGEHDRSVVWSECQSLFSTHGMTWNADSTTPWTAFNSGGWQQGRAPAGRSRRCIGPTLLRSQMRVLGNCYICALL